MTGVARPRGRLPARVYWVRRLLLTAFVLALVVGVARLLGGTTGDAPGPSARPVGADPSVSSSPTLPSPATASASPPDRAAGGTATAGPRAGSRSPAPLPAPTGPCPGSDVVAAPSVTPPAYGGRPVVLTMTLTTRRSPACTWTVSAASLVVRVTAGEDRVWSSQQCPGAVLKQHVVVRRATPVAVAVVWSGKRSDAECSDFTDWAETGRYRVTAAAFGADPVDADFELVPPVRETVTRTPSPSPSPSDGASDGASDRARGGAGDGRGAGSSAGGSTGPRRGASPSPR